MSHETVRQMALQGELPGDFRSTVLRSGYTWRWFYVLDVDEARDRRNAAVQPVATPPTRDERALAGRAGDEGT